MFERFSDRSRRVVVLAQEEARLLRHSHIGTEHLLLGLVEEHEGIGALVLADFGVSREKVCAHLAPGQSDLMAEAKELLELASRSALEHGHNYIGTEHLLLGLIRNEKCVGATILLDMAINLADVRAGVIRRLAGYARQVSERPRDGAKVDLLTDAEHDLVDRLGACAGIYKRLEHGSPEFDIAEFVDKIHQLQAVVMARAAARAYPQRYRLL